MAPEANWWKRHGQSPGKSLSNAINASKWSSSVASATGRVFFITGAATSVISVISNPTQENMALAAADIGMSMFLMTLAGPVGLGVGVVYFGARLAYDYYREENK